MIKNPLDEFQSHSIHYVLLACRSTEDIRAFTDDSASAASLAAIDRAQALGEQIQYGQNTGVFLVLDTRRFSQFTISNFKLDTLVAGFAVPGSNSPNSTAVDLEFSVIDNIGVSFANFLQYLMDQKLQVSFDGMTLMMRVLFIGHLENGTSKVVQSITIPCIFRQIQVDLNEVKGVYNCSLFPLIGMPTNARYNSKWTNIGRASAFFTGKGENTLGAMVNSFEEKVNRELIERYNTANGIVQTDGSKKTITRFGRPVQYMITIPESWKNYTFTGPTQGGTIETEFARLINELDAKKAATAAEAQKRAQENTKNPAKDSYLSVPTNCTLTEVLDIMFSQVTEIRKLGNFTKSQDSDGNIRFYKHLVTVTSDETSFTVHVDVLEYVVPNVMLTASKNTVTELDETLFKTEGGKKLPRNYLEYEYLFSGTNIDVLGLDLKIENLNFLLMQQTKLGQVELNKAAVDGQKQTDGDATQDQRILGGMRRMDPSLMPPRTGDEMKNQSHLGGNIGEEAQAISQQYMQNLSAFYNAGPITARLELRGNPDLMAAVSLTGMPQHKSAITMSDTGASKVNQGVKDAHRKNIESLLRVDSTGRVNASTLLTGPSFVASPVFVKVNVYGPNVDFSTNELIAGKDFSTKLFYENFYYMSKISSVINENRFVQEMELLSYSVYGHQTKTVNTDVSAVKEVK